MSAERTKVLEMLATGTISIEQANQLIEALEAGSAISLAQEAGASSLGSDRHMQGATVTLPKRGSCRRRYEPGSGLPNSAGPVHFTLEQIIALSEHEVDAEFLKELAEAGISDLSFEQIIALSEHEVDPRLYESGCAASA